MSISYKKFKEIILDYFQKEGRHDLPWRKNGTPYRIVISEVMLQQTQVERVISFFNNWMKEFPSWKSLSEAKQTNILNAWKGLGYNSRALRLHKLAQIVVKKYKGRLPKGYDTLITLPGIGPYTAGAIRAFTWNKYTPIIETNIRRVFIYHFFKDKKDISDKDIFKVMEKIGKIENVREWYFALMDYGAILPKNIKYNSNKQSKHYTKQSKFTGSDRQIRGKILEILLKQKNHKISETILFKKLVDLCRSLEGGNPELKNKTERYKKVLQKLEKEGFIKTQKKSIILR